jgi:nucleoside-diphosphate kinase
MVAAAAASRAAAPAAARAPGRAAAAAPARPAPRAAHAAFAGDARALRAAAAPARAAAAARARAAGRAAAAAAPRAELSYVMIKPDGVQRGLVGEIVARFERKGFTLRALKLFQCPRATAEEHYRDLSSKPFFPALVDYIVSGPVVCMVWEGEGVVASGRKLIGATDPLAAEPGTIRGDLAVQKGRNVSRGVVLFICLGCLFRSLPSIRYSFLAGVFTRVYFAPARGGSRPLSALHPPRPAGRPRLGRRRGGAPRDRALVRRGRARRVEPRDGALDRGVNCAAQRARAFLCKNYSAFGELPPAPSSSVVEFWPGRGCGRARFVPTPTAAVGGRSHLAQRSSTRRRAPAAARAAAARAARRHGRRPPAHDRRPHRRAPCPHLRRAADGQHARPVLLPRVCRRWRALAASPAEAPLWAHASIAVSSDPAAQVDVLRWLAVHGPHVRDLGLGFQAPGGGRAWSTVMTAMSLASGMLALELECYGAGSAEWCAIWAAA